MSEFNPINKRRSSHEKPDFEAALAYALGRLERELSPKLRYHSLVHTRDGVVAASERLASMEHVDGEALVLLLTAAYFHDIGFVVQCENHEEAGCSIAEQALPEFHYSSDQILAIKRMILATKLPQTPETRSEEILADADLDVLGRDDFLVRSLELRLEREAFGSPTTEAEWYTSQLYFLQTHRYWTKSAQLLRDRKKGENIALLERLIDRARRTNR
jgi:uncharacterized protein